MDLHAQFLSTLESVANVSLVSKLRDPRLNIPDPDRLNVFIPDLHLVSKTRTYQFGTNLVETLTAVLNGVRVLKMAARPSQVIVYQIGDLLDLWRETDGLDPDPDVASAIEDSHSSLMEAIYDGSLDTQFLLGNHDYDLYRFTNYDIWQRYFYPSPSVMVLHGDIFDWVEELPDGLQNFFVHLFSPNAKPERVQLEAMRPLNVKMRARKRLRNYVQAGVAPVGRLRPPAETVGVERFNVQDANSAPEMLTFLDSARQKCAAASREFGMALTTAVIGHTHHARIAVHEEGGELFALVDCGAWIENCATEDDPTPRPNAQVAAVGANELRIYQLAAR
jgi:UDP-2,3-diacylglucosamine pyrophosphatase LpxH